MLLVPGGVIEDLAPGGFFSALRIWEALMGCPGTEVRIKGDRISGFFHPNISHL